MRRAHLIALLSTLFLLFALVPASGAGAYEAVTLEAPTPAWYTADLHARVVAAGAEGVPLPPEADVPTSALAFTGIRPGSWMIFPAWCTMNFVFGGGGGSAEEPEPSPGQGKGHTKDKSNGKGNGSDKSGGDTTAPLAAAPASSGLAIGTAGHCVEVGDEVTLIMAPGVLVYIGDAVKSVDGGIGNDFALVDIRAEVAHLVNPSMAIVAGPTATGDPQFGDPVLHVGHGAVVGTGGTPRAGVVTFRDGTEYAWDGAAAPGDSGSAVRHASGEAVGNLTHLVVGTRYLPAFIAGTTAERMEQIAGMSITTASLVPDPLT